MQLIRDQVVPALPAQERWRLWSAASASGEEAYSVAIILAEVLGLERARERVAILGTDIDRNVIRQAEEGLYDQQRLDDVPDNLLRRYFTADGSGRWCVKPALKEMCVFRRLNLMSTPWPFMQRFHVVLCRNVLYYFDPDHQRDLVDRFYDVTVPGGWLLTSVTEPVQTLGTRWLPVVSGVYRKA
jgi:chemotaxis protein methyltransferase CheR